MTTQAEPFFSGLPPILWLHPNSNPNPNPDPDPNQVEPFFSGLPPILWLRAVLRVYALADEKQMLQEVHDRLPPQASAAVGSRRHVVCHRGLEL